MNIEGYSIQCFVSDRFRLDGGAMFGSVPKTLWSKRLAADENNRIPMTCRLLVLTGNSRKVVIDLGMGNKWGKKEQEIFVIENLFGANLASELIGVTDIILTHLHFDHVGGATYRDIKNELQLTFPSARIFLQEANWNVANNTSSRERASYLLENITLLQSKMQFVENGAEVLPGVKVFRVDGHTEGMQWVLVGDGVGAVAYPADLIPTSHHIPLPFVMGYDLCVRKTLEEKEAFLEQAVRHKWVVVFCHDPHIAAGIIGKDSSGRYHLEREVCLEEISARTLENSKEQRV